MDLLRSSPTIQPGIRRLTMSFVGQSDRTIFVIQDIDGDIVGHVSLRTKRINAEFESLFVAESARRQGVATQLLAACEGAAQAAGCRTICGYLKASNRVARATYARRGYRLTKGAWFSGELKAHKTLQVVG